MKKTNLLFVALTVLLMMGCSKDELIDEANSDLQLKKGSIANAGVTSLNFTGNSVTGDSFALTELNDGSKIMKNGICSGSITGYGKINPTLSNYSFEEPSSKLNPNYGTTNNFRECQYDYDIDVNGKVSLNTKDYFQFSLTNALYSPANYEAGFTGPGEPEFKGAMFGCPIGRCAFIDGEWTTLYQGEALITSGAGKFKTFAGRKMEVYRNGGTKGINRVTGEMSLVFNIR